MNSNTCMRFSCKEIEGPMLELSLWIRDDLEQWMSDGTNSNNRLYNNVLEIEYFAHTGAEPTWKLFFCKDLAQLIREKLMLDHRFYLTFDFEESEFTSWKVSEVNGQNGTTYFTYMNIPPPPTLDYKHSMQYGFAKEYIPKALENLKRTWKDETGQFEVFI